MKRLPVPRGNSQPPASVVGGWLCFAALAVPAPTCLVAQEAGGAVAPVLDFPEIGLDDPAAYEGYRTRFFRDAAGNTVQVYLNAADGRVVFLLADAANESAGFTVRGAGRDPAAVGWGGDSARAGLSGGERWIELDLTVGGGESVRVGLMALGTMRFERDIQYRELHRGPLSTPLRMEELVAATEALESLDAEERERHLRAIGAPGTAALRARIEPALELREEVGRWRLTATGTSFDGAGSLRLELTGDGTVDARLHDRVLTLRPRESGRAPVRLSVRLTTSAAALTPLGRNEIFTPELLAFVARQGGDDPSSRLRRRRLERQVRSAELLSSREKLMAGLPNFATYFGRDMLMTALMMRDVWTPAMTEHVVIIALGKLGPDGGVSHEEAVGGQAIREAAAEYARLVEAAGSMEARDPDRPRTLAEARSVLASLAATRENHRMVDDDFQLPVVVAGWLRDPRVSDEVAHDILMAPVTAAGETALTLVVRNLGLVAARTAPYTADPRPRNLVGFPRNPDGSWYSGSWRDSGPGYGNGRYALDVNAIWAPAALEAMAVIVDRTEALGLGDQLRSAVRFSGNQALATLVLEPGRLADAIATWGGAIDHFMVELDADGVDAAVERWLASRPPQEAGRWRATLPPTPARLRFPALALDSAGDPVPVVNTDPAVALLLRRGDGLVPAEDWSLAALEPVLLTYPVGLLIPGVGPAVANDAYAPGPVRDAFRADPYHSPRTVWGREANLLRLGLAARIGEARAAAASAGGAEAAAATERERRLRAALARLSAAIEGSGLKHHELWSYRVGPSGIVPVRYGTSSDVQLWNVTDLAVQYALDRLPPP